MGAIRRRGTFAALLLLFCLPASARETVVWLADSTFPSAYIASGRYAGQGIVDRELSWLIANLPQFDHEIIDSTATRNWIEIGREDARCIPAALKSPARAEKAVFSERAVMSWGFMLLVRNDRLPLVRSAQTASGSIDLARLIQQKSLRGVVNSARSFGMLIDPLLASPDGRQAVQSISNSLQGLRMVAAGRADYAIGYAHELGYFRRIDGSAEPITVMPIEGVKRYSPGYVACSNQPIGRAVIEAIDTVLAKEGKPPPYMQAASQWLDDKEFEEISSPALWSSP